MKIFSAGVLRIFPPQWPDGSRAKTPGEAQTEAAKSEERPLKQGWDLSDDYPLVVERFAKNKMVHLVSTVNYMFVWDIQAFWDWYLAIQEAKSQLTQGLLYRSFQLAHFAGYTHYGQQEVLYSS